MAVVNRTVSRLFLYCIFMNDRIPNIDEAFLTNRRNFASLVNSTCFRGHRTIKSEELVFDSQTILSGQTMRQLFPSFVRIVTMHSHLGDIKIMELSKR